MKYKKPKVYSLPAYSTILCQQFSPDGDLLAVGSDSGCIAIYRVDDLVSACRVSGRPDAGRHGAAPRDHVPSVEAHSFSFSVAPAGWGTPTGSGRDEDEDRSGWSVLALASVGGFLLASVRDEVAGRRCSVVAYAWNDLRKKQARVAWNLDGVGNAGSTLPVDINGLAVDSEGSTGGRVLVAGGGPPINPAATLQDNAVCLIDVETRSHVRKPLEGHTRYVHAVSYDGASNLAATASEDGTGKVWDLRLGPRNACVRTLRPSDDPGLSRPHLGRWVGAVALNEDWLALGGGPKPAVWHLKATSGSGSRPTLSWNETLSSGAGGIHALHLIADEVQKLIIGGELGSKVYQVSTEANGGEILAEIPTSFGCTYSIAALANKKKSYRIMTLAGSGGEIDICAPSLNYKNNTVLFPASF